MAKREPKRSPLRGTESLIGAANSLIYVALVKPDCLNEIELMSEYFPLAWQQDVWLVMQQLYSSKSNLDMVLVAEFMERMKKPCPDEHGWLSLLGDMMRDVSGSPKNAQHYASALMNYQRRSRCMEIGTDLISKASEGEDGSDEAIRELMAMSASEKTLDGPLSESMTEFIDMVDAKSQAKEGGFTGLPFGIGGLDRLLGGMEKSHLIILGARPSMGKTAAALQFAINNSNVPVGFISTEQPRREMIQRLVANRGGINGHALRLGKLKDEEWVKLTHATSEINNWPLYMSDKAGPTLNEVVRTARKWKHRYDIQLLLVDYIQRIKVPGKDRKDEVGEIASTLKNVGRELEIPVIALSQINRGVESRPNKRPVLSDLRESGDIEQEADIILTLYRDEVYHDDKNNKGKAEFGCIKNRHGPIGTVICHYEGQHFRFEDFGIEQSDFDEPPAVDGSVRDNWTYRPEA